MLIRGGGQHYSPHALQEQQQTVVNGTVCIKPNYKYLDVPKKVPSNIIIRNGVIGRSSHNGVHGEVISQGWL